MQQHYQASSGGGYAAANPAGPSSSTPFSTNSSTSHPFFETPQQNPPSDAFSLLSVHVPSPSPPPLAAPAPTHQPSSSGLSPSLTLALSESFNALVSSSQAAAQQQQQQQHPQAQQQPQQPQQQHQQQQQQQQQHEQGLSALQNPGQGSVQDQGLNFSAGSYSSASIISGSQAISQYGASGGGGSLPPLIQVEPSGGGGQQGYSSASTSSQPIGTQLESILIPHQPASVAAVAVSAPSAATQTDSYGSQQSPAAPSTSSQYSLIDGYGLQVSVCSPSSQEPAKQQLATQPSSQADLASYGVAQVGSIQQGQAAGQYGNSPQQCRDDRGSSNFQQAVPQYVNPSVNNQQGRDDGASNMMQQGPTQRSYVTQPSANLQYRVERVSYVPENVNQRHNIPAQAPSGLLQHQSTMAATTCHPQLSYPPQQPEGSLAYASPGAVQQGAPAVVYQQPRVGVSPALGGVGASQHLAPPPQHAVALQPQHTPPAPQYPPQHPQPVARQPSVGQHLESGLVYVAPGQQPPSLTPTPGGQSPPSPLYTPAHPAPYPPPGHPDVTSTTPSVPNTYPPEQPNFPANSSAKSPYPPQASDPSHAPQGAAPYPPPSPYSQMPTSGTSQTTVSNLFTPYPPSNQQSQPVHASVPTSYGIAPTHGPHHQSPYIHQAPPYSPAPVQSQNQQTYPPAAPTYPPAHSHPQGPSLSRSSSGSYAPLYPPSQVYPHGGPGPQNPHYGSGAPPPPAPYPPHPSQVYAPVAPAYTPVVPSFDRSFSLDSFARPASPPVERYVSGHQSGAPHAGAYGVLNQSVVGFGHGKGPAYDHSASGNSYHGTLYESRLYEDRPSFGGSDRISDKSGYDNPGYLSSEVFAYDGGRSEPYGARGSGSWGVGSGTGVKSASFSSYGSSGGKLAKAVPKTDSDDVGGGIQKYRVKLLDSSSSAPKDVICQIGLDGVKMIDPSTNRMLRIYPLDTITRWEVNEPSVFTFWSKSAVDVEQRSIKLQSSSNTTAILDTLTAACVQLSEMVARDGRSESKPSNAVTAAETSQPKKSSFADWVQIKPRVTTQEEKQHWVPDEAVTKCTSCGSDFGAFNRRHHCRNCGDLFCDKCTRGRTALNTDEDAQPVRVCDRCLAEVTQRLANIEVMSKAPAPRTHEDLARKLQEEMERNSKKAVFSSNGNQSSISRSAVRENRPSLYPETPQAWPTGSSADKSGGRMKEVACPTCTVHLQVPVPSYGSETLECSVCQHPFLVHAS